MIAESLTASGFVSSAVGSKLTLPMRKRDLLTSLPVVSLSAQIGNIFIPDDADAYTDDGITRGHPKFEGGRVTIEVLGGVQEDVGTQGGGGEKTLKRIPSNVSNASEGSAGNMGDEQTQAINTRKGR